MTYFTNLPNTTYELNSKTTVVKDIFKRTAFRSEYKPYTDLYETHLVNDGESLQSIAADLYGSTAYHWVITIFNEIHDINFEFPLSLSALDIYTKSKYNNNEYKIKHWVNSDNIICGLIQEYTDDYVNPPNPGVEGNEEYTAVTFFEYETGVNDKKRVIKILRKELLSDFISQFRNSLNV